MYHVPHLFDAPRLQVYTDDVLDFTAATAYLTGLINYEKTPAQIAVSRYLNLDRMREALARAGNPQAALRCVHIAGTKGKGSTAAMVESIARAAGLRTGLYTSPHLVTFTERIRVDGIPIAEADLAGLVAEAIPIVEAMRETPLGPPTFFEVSTLLALRWFARCRVELAVLETGMGGRLDATNVVSPLITAITTIALDHTVELGDTLGQIAGEKAGIIKPGVPVISAPQTPEAAEVIARIAGEQGSPLRRVGQEILLLPGGDASPAGQQFTIRGARAEYADLHCPLLGAHQQINAAVAVGMAECLQEAGMAIAAGDIRTGIAKVSWPGRLQLLRESPLLLVDGAHDPASVSALLAALDRHFPGRPRRFILGFSREKDWPRMLRQFASVAVELVLTAADSPRAVAPDELAAEAAALGVPLATALNVAAALRRTLAQASPSDLICVTGSLFAVGDALKAMPSI